MQLPRKKSGAWQSSKWLVYSIVLHVSFVCGLLYLSSHAVKQTLEWVADQQTQPEQQVAIPAGPSQEIEVVPFGGISYSQYVAKQEKQAAADREDKASSLLSRLKGVRMGGAAAGTAGAGALGSSVKAVSGQVASNDAVPSSGFGNAVREQSFRFEPAPTASSEKVRKMTDAEKAALKTKFRTLEAKFRKVYAQALNKEPQLQVTIAFEAKVKPTGYLAVSHFKATGSYRPESLELLKGEMSSLIAQVFVAQDLQGTVIRGESVFIR